jgi:hypothetical protein
MGLGVGEKGRREERKKGVLGNGWMDGWMDGMGWVGLGLD